jgi:putative SOS response-associated peptidase YedK
LGGAGFWRESKSPDGETVHSFTQLTINADDHPLMNHFHKPAEERRSLVIVPAADLDDWLSCRNPEIARSFLRPFPAEAMTAAPVPKA